MKSLARWEPFNDLISLRDAMDRLFEESFIRSPKSMAPWKGGQLELDMYETDRAVVVKAAIPGVKPEDIDITITGDLLTIKGETKEESEVKRENYLYQERHYGAFSRAVSLPAGLETDKADASFENGVLTLKVPKAEEVKPKTVKVTSK
jgi:HSP20 family protein